MKRLSILVGITAIVVANPVLANHPGSTGVPFPSRGACEEERAALSNDDDWLLDVFPDLFSSPGEVRSFLNRAFKCEGSNGAWYIMDHRVEVLDSGWFQKRNR
jgi:hypothetical protein